MLTFTRLEIIRLKNAAGTQAMAHRKDHHNPAAMRMDAELSDLTAKLSKLLTELDQRGILTITVRQ